jgi:hypothetical protein
MFETRGEPKWNGFYHCIRPDFTFGGSPEVGRRSAGIVECESRIRRERVGEMGFFFHLFTVWPSFF